MFGLNGSFRNIEENGYVGSGVIVFLNRLLSVHRCFSSARNRMVFSFFASEIG
jgi:hypothetical protein